MGSLGGFAGWVAGWLGASGLVAGSVAGLVAWWLGSWLGDWLRGLVSGLLAGWLRCVGGLGLGWVGARLGWAWAARGSAGLGVGVGLIGVRQDWARWIGRGWGLGSTGARLARLGARLHWGSAGAVGARVHWGSGAGGLGVGARELERGLDWGVVGLGRGWIGCGWFGHDRG